MNEENLYYIHEYSSCTFASWMRQNYFFDASTLDAFCYIQDIIMGPNISIDR